MVLTYCSHRIKTEWTGNYDIDKNWKIVDLTHLSNLMYSVHKHKEDQY